MTAEKRSLIEKFHEANKRVREAEIEKFIRLSLLNSNPPNAYVLRDEAVRWAQVQADAERDRDFAQHEVNDHSLPKAYSEAEETCGRLAALQLAERERWNAKLEQLKAKEAEPAATST